MAQVKYEVVRHYGDGHKARVIATLASARKANERRHHERAILPLGSSDWFTVREAATSAQPPAHRRFEGTCGRCRSRVTGDTIKWRHDERPADGHRAQVVGVLREL